jgi:hypothetical protein
MEETSLFCHNKEAGHTNRNRQGAHNGLPQGFLRADGNSDECSGWCQRNGGNRGCVRALLDCEKGLGWRKRGGGGWHLQLGSIKILLQLERRRNDVADNSQRLLLALGRPSRGVVSAALC